MLKLGEVAYSWIGLAATLVTIVVVLFLRRLLPPGVRKHGRVPLFFLVLSLLVRLAALPIAAVLGDSTPLRVIAFLGLIFLAFGIVGAAGMVIFDILLARTRIRTATIVRDLLTGVALVVTIFAIVKSSGVNLWSIVTTSAVLTAVIGLALQSTMSNLFAGLSLQSDAALGAGDWIRVGEYVGRIQQVKWRTTDLVTKDGDQVSIPNGQLITTTIVNYSKPTHATRRTIKLGFAYRHAPNNVKQVLLEAARTTPGVLPTPEADCVCLDFGPSEIVYALRFYIDDFGRDAPIEGEVRTRVWYAARRAGLEIPYPQRVVTTMAATDEAEAERQQAAEKRRTALRRAEIFAPLEDADREVLASGMRRASFATGEEIIRQGQPGDSLFLVRKGEVVVRVDVEGATKDVATLNPGDVFGEMSLVTGEPRAATCVAQGDVDCFIVDRDTFQQLLESRPEVADAISSVLAHRQADLAIQREGLSAEAAARREAETRAKLLTRIKGYFHLG